MESQRKIEILGKSNFINWPDVINLSGSLFLSLPLSLPLSLSLYRPKAISFRTFRASCDYSVDFIAANHSKGLDIQLGYGLKFLSVNPLAVQWVVGPRWGKGMGKGYFTAWGYLLNRKVNTAHEVHLDEENYQITHTHTQHACLALGRGMQ